MLLAVVVVCLRKGKTCFDLAKEYGMVSYQLLMLQVSDCGAGGGLLVVTVTVTTDDRACRSSPPP